MTRYPKLVYWLPTLAWLAMIFILSARPSLHVSPVTWQDFTVKKTAHFLEYAVLDLLLIFSLVKTTRISWTTALFLAVAFSVLYGASDEFHQSFIVGRQPHVQDVIIDGLGSLSVSIYLLRFSRPVFPLDL
jgi:VanZ family protein